MKEFFRKFMRTLGIFFGSIIFSAIAGLGAVLPASAQDIPPGDITWEITVDIAPGVEPLQQDTDQDMAARQAQSELDIKLHDRGYSYTVEKEASGGLKVKANGGGTFDTLRQALFADLGNDFSILNGPAEVSIESTVAPDQEIPIVLESNPSTGFMWQVDPDSPFIETAPTTYESRAPVRGLSERQVIYLKATGEGKVSLDLNYLRPWEEASDVTRHVKVSTAALPESVDLSDPREVAVDELPSLLTEVQQPELSSPLPLRGALPSAFDSRSYGIVPAVRNQGSCGSCWSFGTVGAMEINLKKAANISEDLSEQYLLSCNTHGWGCGGGLTAHFYHYDRLGKNQTVVGAVLESDKPYAGSVGICTIPYNHPYILYDWRYVRDGSQNPAANEYEVPAIEQIKNGIYTYGAVTAGVCAGANFNGYGGGVLTTGDTCGGSTNHQIVIVGWNDTSPGYWIVRNSWGPYWGESGYIRMAYSTMSTARLGEGASYAVYLPPSPPPANDNYSDAVQIPQTGGMLHQTYTVNTLGATGEASDPIFSRIGQGNNSVWYRFTPEFSGKLTISTVGSNYDTVLGLFIDQSGYLKRQTWNNNRSRSDKTSVIKNRKVVGGRTYYIEVTNKWGGGMLVLTVSFKPNRPTNISLKRATVIRDYASGYHKRLDVYTAKLKMGTMDKKVFSGLDVYRMVYYRIRPSVNGTLDIQTTSSNYTPIVRVFSLHHSAYNKKLPVIMTTPVDLVAGKLYYIGFASPDTENNTLLDFNLTYTPTP